MNPAIWVAPIVLIAGGCEQEVIQAIAIDVACRAYGLADGPTADNGKVG